MNRPFPMNPNPMTEPCSTVQKTEDQLSKQELEDIEKKKKNDKLNEELINYEATFDKGHPVPPELIPLQIQRAKLD